MKNYQANNNEIKNNLTIFLTNLEKDKDLLEQAIFNSKLTNNNNDFTFSIIDFNEEFFNLLNEIINNSHLFPNRQGVDYRGLTFSLTNKWEEGNGGLLEIVSELTCRLTRGHYFINGNKRTSLIVMNKFLNACGFSLKDIRKENDKNWVYEEKWEKLFLDISNSSIDEELAIDLLEERIWLDIEIYG